MKKLPTNIKPFNETPVFNHKTVPTGLLKSHTTKDGVWGKIVVVKGSLIYRILEPEMEEIILSPETYGVVEPQVKHEVELGEGTEFYVVFHK